MSIITKPIRIILADDHELFRFGFKHVIQKQNTKEIEFIDEASNGMELVESVNKHRPDIVITDIKMPKMDGTHACRIIKEKFPEIGIIAISVFEESIAIMNILLAGASGYLVKSSPIEEIIEAIKQVHDGKPYYSTAISEKVFHEFKTCKTHRQRVRELQFTSQETKVIQLICKQYTTKEIANSLQLGIRTVEDYRHHIQEKIGARNVVGIAMFALIHEIVAFSEFYNF